MYCNAIAREAQIIRHRRTKYGGNVVDVLVHDRKGAERSWGVIRAVQHDSGANFSACAKDVHQLGLYVDDDQHWTGWDALIIPNPVTVIELGRAGYE